MLGSAYTQADAKSIFDKYGIISRSTGPHALVCAIPTHRPDLEYEADLAEELVRMKGFDSLKPTLPKMELRSPSIDPMLSLIDSIRDALVVLGYTELYLNSHYGENDLPDATLPASEHREIENSLDTHQKYLRSDLLPGVLNATYRNRKEYRDIKLFEIGQVFWKNMKPGTHEWRLALAVSLQSGGAYQEILQDFSESCALILLPVLTYPLLSQR